MCSIRPEVLRVAQPERSPEQNHIRAKVEREVFGGETRYLRLAVGDQPLDMLALGAHPDVSTGDNVDLAVAQADIVLLPKTAE